MDVAVIIRQLALRRMEDKAGQRGYRPDGHTPLRRQAKTDAEINGEEPGIASKAVEHSAEEGLLSGHAGQLPVRTVIKVGPYQQDDAEDGMGHVGVIEHHAGRHAENDGQDSNDVRMNSKVIEELCPPQPEGASEMNVEPLFGVL